jgi:hypothetical protein
MEKSDPQLTRIFEDSNQSAQIGENLWLAPAGPGQDAPVKQPSIERILSSLLLALVFGLAAVSLASRLYLVTR